MRKVFPFWLKLMMWFDLMFTIKWRKPLRKLQCLRSPNKYCRSNHFLSFGVGMSWIVCQFWLGMSESLGIPKHDWNLCEEFPIYLHQFDHRRTTTEDCRHLSNLRCRFLSVNMMWGGEGGLKLKLKTTNLGQSRDIDMVDYRSVLRGIDKERRSNRLNLRRDLC